MHARSLRTLSLCWSLAAATACVNAPSARPPHDAALERADTGAAVRPGVAGRDAASAEGVRALDAQLDAQQTSDGVGPRQDVPMRSDAQVANARDARADAAPAEAPDAARACEAVRPRSVSGKYVLAFDKLHFEVDPARGARITRFSYGGRDILSSASVHADNFGATFWTSPQSDWNWPPPAAYDTGPYSARIEGASIVLESGATTGTKPLQVTKNFSVDPASGALVLVYAIRNRGSSAFEIAPWEVSRHPPLGITFFPAGERVVTGSLPVSVRDGVVWYQSDPSKVLGEFGDKYTSDGKEGWLAYSDGQLLLVKTFPDLTVRQQAPGEGEVQLYANKAAVSAAYVEAEAQGPYAALAPGASVTWTVRWHLSALPAEASFEVGSAALVRLARAAGQGERCRVEANAVAHGRRAD